MLIPMLSASPASLSFPPEKALDPTIYDTDVEPPTHPSIFLGACFPVQDHSLGKERSFLQELTGVSVQLP